MRLIVPLLSRDLGNINFDSCRNGLSIQDLNVFLFVKARPVWDPVHWDRYKPRKNTGLVLADDGWEHKSSICWQLSISLGCSYGISGNRLRPVKSAWAVTFYLEALTADLDLEGWFITRSHEVLRDEDGPKFVLWILWSNQQKVTRGMVLQKWLHNKRATFDSYLKVVFVQRNIGHTKF